MNDNHPQNHSVDSYGLGLSNPKLHSVTGSHRTRNQYNPLCVAFFCHPLGSFQKRRIYLKLFFRIEIIRRWFYVYIYIYFWYINIISVQNNIHKYIYIYHIHTLGIVETVFISHHALFCQTPRFASLRFRLWSIRARWDHGESSVDSMGRLCTEVTWPLVVGSYCALRSTKSCERGLDVFFARVFGISTSFEIPWFSGCWIWDSLILPEIDQTSPNKEWFKRMKE